MEDVNTVQFDIIHLEKLRMVIQQIIEKDLIYEEDKENPILIDILNNTVENVILQFRKSNVVKHQNKTIFFEFPKSWKDQFKLQYKKNWLIKKWIKKKPIQFIKHKYEIDKMTVFPKFIIPESQEFKDSFAILQSRRLE